MISYDRALLIAGLGVGVCIAAVILLNGFVLALGVVLLLVGLPARLGRGSRVRGIVGSQVSQTPARGWR